MSQPPRVWLPMLWATIPRHPLLPADLTTACRSQCPTRKEKAAAKRVNISEAFILHPTDPIFLSPWNNVCVFALFVFWEPLSNPCGLTGLFVSCESASWWGNWYANSEAATRDSWNGRQVHHQHAQRHHPPYTPHPGPAGQKR